MKRLIEQTDFLPTESTKRRNSLFLSFYLLIQDNNTDEITSNFELNVNLPSELGEYPEIFNYYTDQIAGIEACYYSYFLSPNTHDTFVIQLGLNSRAPVEQSWPAMKDILVAILESWFKKLDPKIYMGYSLVYKADIAESLLNNDIEISSDVKNLITPLFSDQKSEIIAIDKFHEDLILLADLDKVSSGLVYLVLSNGSHKTSNGKEKWNLVTQKVIYHDNALLQFTDKIYHKAEYLRRDFDSDKLNKFISDLQEISGDILENTNIIKQSDIESLSIKYKQLIEIKNILSRDLISSEQQMLNFQHYIDLYKRLDQFDSNIFYILSNKINAIQFYFNFQTKKSELVIDKMKITLDFANLQISKIDEKTRKKYELYLAITGTALGTLQVVDSDATQKILINYGLKAPSINDIIVARIFIMSLIVLSIFVSYFLVTFIIKKARPL